VRATCSSHVSSTANFESHQFTLSVAVKLLEQSVHGISSRKTFDSHRFMAPVAVLLGLHGDTFESRVENRVEITAKCLRVNRLDSSVAGIL
jgi:predicted ferric reductase